MSGYEDHKDERIIGRYKIGKEIGKGSFATVYRCVNTKTNEAVALKSVVRSKLKSRKLVENLEVEISILKTMKHQHIVALHDCIQTSGHFHLVMDYCSMGDLSYFIRKRNVLMKTHPVISSLFERYPSPEGSHGLNEVLVIHFLKQLVSALQFLRDKSLIHRDIKPQNLLLCPPIHSKKEFISKGYVGLWELPILKIADFGFARFLPSSSMAETLCGSPLYMAPEILRYEKYNAKADLWSVGAVLFEMTVGRPPFRADNHVQLLKTIERSNDRIKFPSAAQVPDALKGLIKSLLKYNPAERISFAEFFDHLLVKYDLEGNDEPLETSDMDENLFISEYISPIRSADPTQPITRKPHQRGADRDKTNPKVKLANEKLSYEMEGSVGREQKEVGRKPPEPVAYARNSRDEEIKDIISNNSPVLESGNFQGPRNNDTSITLRKKEQDVVLEKDYVLVEKRAVEVNAIADELAFAGRGTAGFSPALLPGGPSKDDNQLLQNTHDGNAQDARGVTQPVNAKQRNLPERRVSISISPTNALSKAIVLASNRLFGSNARGPQTSDLISENNDIGSTDDEKKSTSADISSPNFANNLLLKQHILTSTTVINAAMDSSSDNGTLSKDGKVLRELESIATKAHALNLFADVKFGQLIPSPPSSGDDEFTHQKYVFPPRMVKLISEEGVTLYVKTLALLAKGMLVAGKWWQSRFGLKDDGLWSSEGSKEKDTSDAYNKLPEESSAENSHLYVKINRLVQWIRDKFNINLEKAEFVKLRLQESEKQLMDSNFEKTEDDWDGIVHSDTYKRGEPCDVVAEKLIFDRALEISRNAAVNELVKEDLKGCELAYSTAIWMLEALLDEEFSGEEEKLDKEDRTMIEKFIVSIGNRLSVLKKKLEIN